jgi:lysophospholipase L1-like esterase
VFIGDSHLARLRRGLRGFAGDVRNAAEGGATSRDLLRQADGAGVGASDCVVVSVGTNDAAPWKQVPVAEYVQRLTELMTSQSRRGWVLVAPPGVVEARLMGARDRTNAVIDDYRLATVALGEDVGGHVVRTDLLLESLGARAFAEDGLHLNATGYRALVPALESACAAQRP